jgi:ABC-2 type transport system permease protein
VTGAGRPSVTGKGTGKVEAGTSWLADGQMVGRQVRYEQIAFWRNRVGAIFTVGFSVVFVVLLGTSAGSSRVSYLGNIRLIQYYVPGFVAYGVMAACFNTLCITLVVRRETGLLKRLRLSPLPTWVLLSAIFTSTVVVALIQVVLTLAIGRVAFHVHLPQDVGAFAFTLLVGVLSFTALGVAMSTVVPNQESAGPVTSVVFFVLLFLSGLWFVLTPGSGLAHFSAWFPLRRFILAVFLSFNVQHGVSPWDWHDLLVVAVWGVAGILVAVRRFRWAPWRT